MLHSPALRFRPGLAAGVGLGAFIDGILFHQVLQWHHLVSDNVSMKTLDGLETNTLADGLFHVFSWIVSATGIWMLWQAGRRGTMPARNVLLGSMLVGWGGFTLVDVLTLHFLGGLHHLHQGSFETGSDILYTLASIAIVGLGIAIGRGGDRDAPVAPAGAQRVR